MSIIYYKKDITTTERGIIAHGVNCQGKMNSGIAKVIRDKWPVVYTEFSKQPPGHKMLGYVNMVYINDNLYVANCFTQEYYGRNKEKYASVGAILYALNRCIEYATVLALPFYMPKIGCGLGGLDWALEVEPCVYKIAEHFDINVCEI